MKSVFLQWFVLVGSLAMPIGINLAVPLGARSEVANQVTTTLTAPKPHTYKLLTLPKKGQYPLLPLPPRKIQVTTPIIESKTQAPLVKPAEIKPVEVKVPISKVNPDLIVKPADIFSISLVNKVSKGTFPLLQGDFYGVSSPYGPRYIAGYSGFHGGIDLAAPQGAIIKAWKAGKVETFYQEDGCGNGLYITHQLNTKGQELEGTMYCHTSKYLVKNNALVKEGQPIALVGSTGHSSGPHLHFSVYLFNKTTNPYPFLKKSIGVPSSM